MSTTAASVVESLRQGVSRLQMSHHATQSNLSRAAGNLAGSLQKIEGLEGDLKRASERYIAMQKVCPPMKGSYENTMAISVLLLR